MRNGLSVLTDKNSLSYFLTSAHFHEVYQVLYILCIRNNIFSKKKATKYKSGKVIQQGYYKCDKKNQNQLISGWPEENSSAQSRL